MRLVVALLSVVLLASPALAVQPGEQLPDAAQEARARGLSRELRCMVCQNQSIDDSDAPLARDLRQLVRERIRAGDSDQQVIDFLVRRYGEFVLLAPRFGWHTLILWGAPLLFVLAGGLTLYRHSRRRTEQNEPISDAEKEALARLSSDPPAS